MGQRVKIEINGREYPCLPTMGAMLRFKRETGREVTDIKPDSLSDMAVYLWCCVKSACARDGVDFPYEVLDFADRVTPTDLAEWAASIGGAQAADEPSGADGAGDEKKS